MKVSYDENWVLIGYGDCIVKPIGWEINREKDEKKAREIIEKKIKEKNDFKKKAEQALKDLVAKK